MDKKKILMVDDEETLCRMIKENLEKTGAYKVHTETKGKNVLAVVRKFRPDLIILDIMMPKKGGIDVAYQLQKDEKTSSLPIIFFSAIASKDQIKEFVNLTEQHCFVAKPAKTKELVEVIEKMLDGQQD